MKQFRIIFTISVFVAALFSCSKEDIPAPQAGGVTFVVDLSSLPKSTTPNIGATPSAVVISVEDSYGNQVYTNHLVAIELVNSVYQTKTIPVEPGSYKLTKFMVVDTEAVALYASPMSYSGNAAFVSDPLPVKFNVQKSQVTQLSPNTLATANKNAEEFGYPSFSLKQTEQFMFQVGAYAYNSNSQQFELTGASLSIASNKGALVTQKLGPGIDSIALSNADEYILSVSKEGYQTWTDTLTASDLLHFYATPMAITLVKTGETSFHFVTKQDSLTQISIKLQSQDNQTPLQINWGDGSLQVSTSSGKITHLYKTVGNYPVWITGNIASLSSLSMTSCRISTIDLTQATGLQFIDISRNLYLKSLDLHATLNLKNLYCMQDALEHLTLPQTDSLQSLYCSVNQLTSLDLTSCPRLKNLFCDRNSLTTLDISTNSNLRVLYCYKNAISSLDLSNCPAIETLDCRNNQITNIDLTKSLQMKGLSLTENPIDADNASNLLVTLLANVKQNPRSGEISISVSVSDGGKTAKENLENQYQWIVNTN